MVTLKIPRSPDAAVGSSARSVMHPPAATDSAATRDRRQLPLWDNGSVPVDPFWAGSAGAYRLIEMALQGATSTVVVLTDSLGQGVQIEVVIKRQVEPPPLALRPRRLLAEEAEELRGFMRTPVSLSDLGLRDLPRGNPTGIRPPNR
jgi:hypothetical protein